MSLKAFVIPIIEKIHIYLYMIEYQKVDVILFVCVRVCELTMIFCCLRDYLKVEHSAALCVSWCV